MPTYAVPALIAIAGVIGVTPLVRRLSARARLIDEPGGRRIHDYPVPRLGGLAIAAGFALGLVAALTLGTGQEGTGRLLPGLLIGGLLALALGVIDDAVELTPAAKLAGQIAVALAAFAAGLQIDRLRLGGGEVVDLGWLALPLTVTFVVVVVNSFNLIDGLDGLAAGIGAIAFAWFAVIAVGLGRSPEAMLLAAAAGAAAGFLVYNSHPASIIMGDGGSMFLGFLAAAFSIQLAANSGELATLPVPLLVLVVPLADLAWAVTRRAASRRSIFDPDAAHVHHRLLGRGLSQRGAVLVLYAIGVLGGLAGWLLSLV